jgi:hypothetical protein
MIDTTSWDVPQHDAVKEELELYKAELRPLIRDANLYHISERPDGVHWDAVEYFDPQTRCGIVYVFHGSIESEGEHKFLLPDLHPASRFRLRFHDHSAPGLIARGDELMKTGFTVRLPIANSSDIIFLQDLSAETSSKGSASMNTDNFLPIGPDKR